MRETLHRALREIALKLGLINPDPIIFPDEKYIMEDRSWKKIEGIEENQSSFQKNNNKWEKAIATTIKIQSQKEFFPLVVVDKPKQLAKETKDSSALLHCFSLFSFCKTKKPTVHKKEIDRAPQTMRMH